MLWAKLQISLKKENSLTALAMLEPTLLDQAGLQLRDPPVSASVMLGLKVSHLATE